MRHRSLRGGYILIGYFGLCCALYPAETTDMVRDLLAGAAGTVELAVDNTAGQILAFDRILN
ncbi:MAG: hypothetical protein ACR2PO_00360 [Methyloligellaceae bacterium]